MADPSTLPAQHALAPGDDLSSLSACILVDGDTVTRWQASALEQAIARGLRIACVYVCTNTHIPRAPLKHVGYYGIRLTSMRTAWTRHVPWRPVLGSDVPVRTFESAWEGIWQRVPAAVCKEMAAFEFDVVVKFGMYLLRDPDDLPAPHGVLSFHHGDPASYRGRPAGFYEVLDDAEHVGTIVQRIGNKLDAGSVLAYASNHIVPYSYRRTLEATYGNGTHLLVKALRNCRDGITIEHPVTGKNYKLPSNRTVARFVYATTMRRLRRMAYGASMQKRWRVGRTDRVDPTTTQPRIELSQPHDLPVPNGFTFTADPCPGPDGEIFCEAMDAKSGKGRIVVIADGRPPAEIELPQLDGEHCSYPFVVEHAGRRYLVPEMTRAGPPRLFELDGTSVVSSRILAGLEDLRIVDPTLVFRAGRWWLFGGLPGTAVDLLYLWSAPELAGPYTPHPDNPVVMDAARARPAGPIIVATDGRLFRPGQDSRGGYGDGITVSEILEWTAETYKEEPRTEVKVGGRKGPHTLFVTNDATIVDSYVERFDALAWLNRIKNTLAS